MDITLSTLIALLVGRLLKAKFAPAKLAGVIPILIFVGSFIADLVVQLQTGGAISVGGLLTDAALKTAVPVAAHSIAKNVWEFAKVAIPAVLAFINRRK